MGRLTLRGAALAVGSASGRALVLREPLSLWGGLDPASGLITDVHHPQYGASVRGRVLAMPAGRGSSSSSSVLAEAVRAGTAPVAIVLGEADLILAVGAVVAAELYGVRVPVVQLAPDDVRRIVDGAGLEVHAGPAATVMVDA
jgi:predicted aconitase with swiveling domain